MQRKQNTENGIVDARGAQTWNLGLQGVVTAGHSSGSKRFAVDSVWFKVSDANSSELWLICNTRLELLRFALASLFHSRPLPSQRKDFSLNLVTAQLVPRHYKGQ